MTIKSLSLLVLLELSSTLHLQTALIESQRVVIQRDFPSSIHVYPLNAHQFAQHEGTCTPLLKRTETTAPITQCLYMFTALSAGVFWFQKYNFQCLTLVHGTKRYEASIGAKPALSP